MCKCLAIALLAAPLATLAASVTVKSPSEFRPAVDPVVTAVDLSGLASTGYADDATNGVFTFLRAWMATNVTSGAAGIATETDPTVGLTNGTLYVHGSTIAPLTRAAADSAFFPRAIGEAWEAYWNGEDVRVTITNYGSSTEIPALSIEQNTSDNYSLSNTFQTVWREMGRWESFLGTNWTWSSAWPGFADWSSGIESWSSNVTSELDQKADRAWGFYDSTTGEYSPDGYTQISSSNILIAAGMSYQRRITSSAEIWILTSNEPYSPCGISTNGGFQIRDGSGSVQFEIIKGERVTVSANANAVSVTNGTLYAVYNIISTNHPTTEVCLDLETADWKSEGASDCPATVFWSGSSGRYVAAISPKVATSKCFCKAYYTREGSTYINNRCAVGMSQLVLGGVTYDLGTASIDGHTVLTLTPAN